MWATVSMVSLGGANMNRSAGWLVTRTSSVWRSAALTCAVLLGASAHMAHAGIDIWTSHGPYHKPYVAVLAIDPTTPSTLYAGTERGVFSIQQVFVCVGDCDDSGNVTVNELITIVNIALNALPVSVCLAGNADNSGTITIDEILSAVNKALTGCAGG